MSRLRMMSGMAAAGVGAAKGPALAAIGFVRTVLCAVFSGLLAASKAVYRVIRTVVPWLLIAVLTSVLCYLGYLLVCHWAAESAAAAEATKHEIAFNESLAAAADSAENLEINDRVRKLIDSQMADSGEMESEDWFSSFEGVPHEQMRYWTLTADVGPDTKATRLTVTVLRSMETDREYVSVELSGEQIYLCVAELNIYGTREDLWPWVYKGVGQWEHLLAEMEDFVDKDRQQREIDSRFGSLEEDECSLEEEK